MRLAYVVSRFPVLTETFVLREILELQAAGWPVEVFALRHTRQVVTHAAARQLERRVHFPRPRATIARTLRFVRNHPDYWERMVRTTVSGYRSAPPVLARTLLILPIAVAWAEDMRKLRVGHVHAHFGTYPASAALVTADLLGIGFSFTVHAHDLFADNLMLADKARRARFVITISEFNRRRLIELVGPDGVHRVHVIHCGVDPDMFPFNPVRGTNLHSVLSVAALREYKGLHNLIEACRLLRAFAPDTRFGCRIVGDGPQLDALRRQIRAYGLEDCVWLAGPQDEASVRAFLACSDTFVLPSIVAHNGYMDGIPVALMEAMASGVPVIASSLSGVPELVRDEDTGLLVQPGRPDALRDAIQRCWSQPFLTATRARHARTLIEREYDLRTNTRVLAGMFAEVIDTHRSGPICPTPGRFGSRSAA